MPTISWPHEEAARLLRQTSEKAGAILFETGYGPSGMPHIGTFAEVARTNFVIRALKHISPEVETQLITFSDDMDGLRSIPENIPNKSMLQPFLGMPLSSIPDPFGIADSYAGYMNAKLQQFLDSFGFEYSFRSSTENYRTGVFNPGLRRIMENYDAIRNAFVATIAPEKRSSWSPFFPICGKCGRIYTTRVTDVREQDYTVSYACDTDHTAYASCGHVGHTSILDGNVKLGWKVDWALRWLTFGIDYEMYGKDLIDSAAMATQICDILGIRPPLLYKYELFLDENGAKVSKKIGNGITMDEWMSYSPLGALLLFLLADPNKARRMGLPILPKIVDDYVTALRKNNDLAPLSEMWYIDHILHRQDARDLEGSDITYTLLTNVATNLGVHDAELLYSYVKKYEPSASVNATFFRSLCEKAVAYSQDFAEKQPQPKLLLDLRFLPHGYELESLIQNQEDFEDLTGEQIQAIIFSVARRHHLPQGEWFRFLYEIVLKRPRGPRLGPFFAMLGKQVAVQKLLDGLSALATTVPFDANDVALYAPAMISDSRDLNVHIRPVVILLNNDSTNVWRSLGKAIIYCNSGRPLVMDGYLGEGLADSYSCPAVDAEEGYVFELASIVLSDAIAQSGFQGNLTITRI